MGITVMQRLGDGSLALIDSDVLGIARRLQEGDPTLGWPGDRDLELAYDHDRKVFVALHVSRDGTKYPAATHPTCDENLVRKVAASDRHRADVAAEIDAHNAALEREQQRQWDDRLDNDLIPKARWAIRRDDGWDTRGQTVGYTKGT